MNGQDYEKMIYSIAHKYSFGNDFEDLCQQGRIGCMKAMENYDASKGSNNLSSYVYLYIKGEILKYIRENNVIKISKDLISLNNSITKAREVLAQKMMRTPTDEELSLFLEIPLEKINEASIASEYVKSLDYELNDDGKEMTLYDSISYNEKGYDDNILDLREEISKLSEEEKKLIKARYYDDKSQQETSEILGMSQVQVSRNETIILTKLRTKLAS